MVKKGKKVTSEPNTAEAIKEILDKPVTGSFGGKAVEVEPLVDALNVLKAKKVEHMSPTLVTKLVYAVMRDGHEEKFQVEAEEEDDEEEEEFEPYTERELKKLSEDDLKGELKFYDVKVPRKADKKALVALVLEAQEDYFAEEDEEEEAEEAPTFYKKAELKKMDMDELKGILVEEWETPAKGKFMKGLKKTSDAIKEILRLQDEWEEAQEEIEEDEAEEEEAEEEFQKYLKTELKELDEEELKEILDEWEVKYPKKAKKSQLINLILEAQLEDEEED